jgi:amino-acid N-acetyltransferase
MESEICIRRAEEAEVEDVFAFLQDFVDKGFLLARTLDELRHLIKASFVAKRSDQVVGFSAVEVYSKKLAEIQCMAVCGSVRRQGVGKRLVENCVAYAKAEGVRELMAISTSTEFLMSCGFDYSLPQQKRAFFIEPQKS